MIRTTIIAFASATVLSVAGASAMPINATLIKAAATASEPLQEARFGGRGFAFRGRFAFHRSFFRDRDDFRFRRFGFRDRDDFRFRRFAFRDRDDFRFRRFVRDRDDFRFRY